MESNFSRFGLAIISGVAILMVLLASGLSHLTIRASADSSRWVEHPYDVLQTLEQLSSAIDRAAASSHAFVHSGSDSDNTNFHADVAAALRHQANVRRLTANDATQQARLDDLAGLV